jgi:hypothetical protein
MTRAKQPSGFVRIYHDLMDSPAWRTASLGARCVVLAIWRRHSGKNNGKIPYGRRDAQADLGCGSHQAVRYLGDAQERGFVVITRRGSFDWKNGSRAARTALWRLTMERCNGRDPTNEWAAWTPPGNSFDGCRSDTAMGAGATPIPPEWVPERHPSGRGDGCRSDTTSKTKSSYQGEDVGIGGGGAATGDGPARGRWT